MYLTRFSTKQLEVVYKEEATVASAPAAMRQTGHRTFGTVLRFTLHPTVLILKVRKKERTLQLRRAKNARKALKGEIDASNRLKSDDPHMQAILSRDINWLNFSNIPSDRCGCRSSLVPFQFRQDAWRHWRWAHEEEFPRSNRPMLESSWRQRHTFAKLANGISMAIQRSTKNLHCMHGIGPNSLGPTGKRNWKLKEWNMWSMEVFNIFLLQRSSWIVEIGHFWQVAWSSQRQQQQGQAKEPANQMQELCIPPDKLGMLDTPHFGAPPTSFATFYRLLCWFSVVIWVISEWKSPKVWAKFTL